MKNRFLFGLDASACLKMTVCLSLAASLAANAATEEQINKRFTAQPDGKVIVDVDFGSIKVTTNSTSEVVVDVYRKISRRSKSDEQAYLKENPVNFSEDGNTVTIRSKGKSKTSWSLFGGRNQNEAKYVITVPAKFNAQLRTSGGSISVSDITGVVNSDTSGGGLRFERLHGPLIGNTSGGSIRVSDCQGQLKINTSGGGIDVAGGSGSLEGETSGGSVSVKRFQGPARVETSGGGITIENVTGKIEGTTSGGSIHAVLTGPVTEPVKLETSGGGVRVQVPEDAAFELDASTSGGGVTSELPVTTSGKRVHDHLQGPVNGGGKIVRLRSSGGGIHLVRSGQRAKAELEVR